METLKDSSKTQSKDISENRNPQNQSMKTIVENLDSINDNNKRSNNGNPFGHRTNERSHDKRDRSLSKSKENSSEFREIKSKELDRSTKEEARYKRNPFSQHPQTERDSSGKRSNEKQTPSQIVEYNLFLGNKSNKKNHKEFSENIGKGINIIEQKQSETIIASSELNNKAEQKNNTIYSVNKIETKAIRNPFACKTKQSFGQALEENRNQRIGETFKKGRTPQQQHSNNIENLDKENKPTKESVPQLKEESKDHNKKNYAPKTPSRQRRNSRYYKREENKNLEKTPSQEIKDKKDPKTDKYPTFLSTPKVLEEERMFYKRLSIDDISKLDKPGNHNLPHLARREKVETIPIRDQQPNAKNTLNNQCDLVETPKVEEENKSKFVIPKLGRKYQDSNTNWQRHKSYPRQSQKFDTPLLKLERKMEQSDRELQLQREQEAKAKRNPLHNTPELINKPIELENVKNLKTGPTKPNLFETPKSEGGPQQESISIGDVKKRNVKNMNNLQNEKEMDKIQIASKPKYLAISANVSEIMQNMLEKEKKNSKEAKINVVSKHPEIQNGYEKSQKDENEKKLTNNEEQTKNMNVEKNIENRKEIHPKPLKESCEVSKTQICKSISPNY